VQKLSVDRNAYSKHYVCFDIYSIARRDA
jgi:hypothetical protein